jgi:NAD(P)-dependent dehydrogenase (short-subunit alcohol dehydrogenase family)
MGRVEGKIALVTGGATGLGKASALMLADEGAKVVVTDIDEDGGRATAEEIQGAGGEAIFVAQDTAKEDDWTAAIERTLDAFGRLDILLNNAGVGIPANIEETSLEDWRWVMSVNLDGVFLGTKHAIEAMKRSGGGSIINMSSIEGLVGDRRLAAYDASKGGVISLTKSAALHCAKSGLNIRVNTVHPGFIETRMVAGFVKSQDDPEETRRRLERAHPVGHLGEPDDVAYGVVYLASDESKFVTGSALVIDGGYTAQ